MPTKTTTTTKTTKGAQGGKARPQGGKVRAQGGKGRAQDRNGRTPGDQALQVVDVTVGAYASVADAVRSMVEQWRDPRTRAKELDSLRRQVNSGLVKVENRGGELRQQVTDDVSGRARRARKRVEPVYRRRVKPVYRRRVKRVARRVRARF
jgi:Arc/MetJ-type ribon-helix-helix transcriptional regulator